VVEREPSASYEQLVDSVLRLAETAVAWIRQEMESTVRDKVAKPLIVATAVAAVAASALSATIVMGIAMFTLGCIQWLGYAIGSAASAVVIGLTLVALVGLSLYVMIKAVRQ
jgi:hypothetical protein